MGTKETNRGIRHEDRDESAPYQPFADTGVNECPLNQEELKLLLEFFELLERHAAGRHCLNGPALAISQSKEERAEEGVVEHRSGARLPDPTGA